MPLTGPAASLSGVAASTADAIAGSDTSKYLTPAAGNARALHGDSSRAIEPYQISDGAMTNRRNEWTPGAAGNVAGLGTMIVGYIPWPTSNPSANAFICTLSASNAPILDASPLNNGLGLALTTTGSLALRQYGATASTDSRQFSLAAALARSTYSGLLTPVSIYLPGNSTANPVVWINGVDVSASFTLTTGGTAPNWMPTTLDCTKFLTGYNWPAGRVPQIVYGPGEWSAAEHLAFHQTGVLPTWWEAGTGSAVERIQNGDMSSATGWVLGSGWSITGGKLVHTGTSSYGDASQSNKVVAGAKYRATFTVDAISGNPLLFQNGSNTTIAIISTTGTKVIEFVATDTGAIKFKNSNSSGTMECTLDDFSLIALGPVFKPLSQPGCAVMPDSGSNSITGLLASGMTAVGALPDHVVVPGAPMTADGFILADQVLTDSRYVLVDAYARQTGTATSTITIKETSSGGTTVATAALSSSVTRVQLTVSNALSAGGKKLHLANSSWGGNTVTPFLVFRRCQMP